MYNIYFMYNIYHEAAAGIRALMPRPVGPKEFGRLLLNRPRRKFKGYMRNKK